MQTVWSLMFIIWHRSPVSHPVRHPPSVTRPHPQVELQSAPGREYLGLEPAFPREEMASRSPLGCSGQLTSCKRFCKLLVKLSLIFPSFGNSRHVPLSEVCALWDCLPHRHRRGDEVPRGHVRWDCSCCFQTPQGQSCVLSWHIYKVWQPALLPCPV